jgi:hypothetical protein
MRIITIFALLFLVGCGARDYQGLGFGGGGYEQQLEPGIWRVGYRDAQGNAETVQTYWLYHAADLALANGFDGFEVLSNIRLVDGLSDGSFAPYRIAAGATFIFIPGHPPVNQIEADIRLLKSPVAVQPGRVFDAATLRARLQLIVFGPKCTNNNVCPHPHWYIYKP